MRKFILMLSLLFSLTSYFSVHAQDSLLTEAFKKNRYPIHWEADHLAGSGFDFLKEKASASPFFLIGEQHGIAEVAQFTAALFQQLKSVGYKYYATETGPYTAELLQEIALKKNWQKELEQLFQQYPASIPFFNWQEEGAVLQSVVTQDEGTEALIWGLDQEFAACFRLYFDQLRKEGDTETSRKVAQSYYDLAMQNFQESASTKNPGKSFMAIAQPKDFETLRDAFAGQEESIQLIRELEESIDIYQLWFKRQGLKSNRDRAALMKRHFMTYYQKAQQVDPEAKVLIKLGSNHTYRGPNALNVYDIGNFLSELANQQGQTSFHLYVIGKKGTRNAYTPFSQNEADKKQDFDTMEELASYAPLLHATSDQTWQLIDLAPLQEKLWAKSIKNVSPKLRKLIWSYDAVLLIPEVQASSFYEKK